MKSKSYLGRLEGARRKRPRTGWSVDRSLYYSRIPNLLRECVCPALAERAQYQQYRPPWTQGNGKNQNVERRNYTSRNSTSYKPSPSSVTNKCFLRARRSTGMAKNVKIYIIIRYFTTCTLVYRYESPSDVQTT